MEQEKSTGSMGFFEHLDELRVRIMRSLYVFTFGFLFNYFVTTDYVMIFLRRPLFAIMPADQQKLYFTSLFENFLTHLKISGVSAIFLFSPYFLYELWGFIAPGLYERERKLIIPFVAIATAFFFAGGAFAYFILFPTAFKFFVTFGFDSDTPILTINSYYSTVLKLILLFGAAFEMPVLIGLLGYLGVIDAKWLRENRRNGILGISIMCAMFAPPDAISMLIMMVPLVFFYEATIIFVDWVGKKERLRDGEPGKAPEVRK